MASRNNKKLLNSKSLFEIIIKNVHKENFVAEMLARKEVESFLPKVLEKLKKYFEKQKQENTLKIFSPTPLDDYTVDSIAKSFGQQNLKEGEGIENTKVIEDKSIIAGVIIKYKNSIVDASLNNAIAKAFIK